MLEKLCIAKYFQTLRHQGKEHLCSVKRIIELLGLDAEKQSYFLKQVCAAEELSSWRADFERQISEGICFAIPGSIDYPSSFYSMEYSPILMSYVGHPVWLDKPALAVVGSREITRNSIDWMETHLVEWVKERTAFIVSGGARGVDQKAHEICLRNGIPTVAVIPSGIGKVYPPNFVSWEPEIIQGGGAIVSEYPFEQEIRKHYFQARNRIISGLAICSLIVQAERRSGTLITARRSLEQGRPVLVIPSHPCDPKHAGGLDLYMDGAVPLRDAQDLKLFFDSECLARWPWRPSLVAHDSTLH